MLTPQEKPMKALRRHNILGPCAVDFAASNTGSWRIERPEVDSDQCIRCGTCQRVCPVDIVTIDKTGPVPVSFEWKYCKGCGICANECPKQCITMIPEGGAV